MNFRPVLLLLFLLQTACGDSATTADSQDSTIDYPTTVKTDHTDQYHGTTVADPYRWLEDDVRESADVASWVNEQNSVTGAYLDGIPERADIAARLRQLWDYDRYGLPVKKGGRYFFEFNDGLQNQDSLYVQEALDDEPRLLLDPNDWSGDGTVALAAWYPSPDGKLLAYLLQDSGSDWNSVAVLDVDTGETRSDSLEWLKYSGVSWSADSSGFYYSRFPAPASGDKFQSLNTNQALYYHELGTAQAADRVIYARPDHPEWGYQGDVTEDGRFLVITIWQGTDSRYQVALLELAEAGATPHMLIEGFDYDFTLVGSQQRTLFFRTTSNAPRGRLIAIDVDRLAAEHWREIIPESTNVLTELSLVGGRFVAEYMQDAWSLVRLFEMDGRPAGDVELPGIGSASGFKGSASDPETFYSYSSFDTPPTINRLDVNTGKSEIFKQPTVDFDSDEYTVEQRFYHSADGTRIPMFIAHRKDLRPDGNNPTVLYGYGGFNISLKPAFSVTQLAWMELGGVWAVANLRGGGEYGEEWHKAGTRLQKQNVFDDFIAAAEYLVEQKFTNPGKLAIFGGSNGGLLVGAVTNQRPELFAAALPAVGVMDMLRFHRFTAGRFWVDDYGSADNPEEFAALRAYSPYHNVKPGARYPAVMITTADTDDRVVPGHSFKYAAAMQEAQAGERPILIRIESRAGHGAGTPTDKAIEVYADRWGFLLRHLNMRLPEGYGQPPAAE
jgi:prolyl oligopeptidase